MAKGSLIGLKSGKLGDIVMYARNGKQTYRIHRTSVKNPRTAAQMKQRAKFNLSGRLSKLVSPVMIQGLQQGSVGDNRSAFSRANLHAISSVRNSDNTGFIASIAPESIIFSRGTAVLPEGVRIGATFGASNNTVIVRIFCSASVTEETMNNFAARAIVLGINTKTSEYDISATAMLNKPTVFGVATTTETTLNVQDMIGHKCFAYVIPMSYDSNEAAIASTTFLGTQLNTQNSTEIMAELIDRGASLSSMAYGISTLNLADNGGNLTEFMVSRLEQQMDVDHAGAITGQPGAQVPDYSNIILQGGTLDLPYSPAGSLDGTNLTLSWTDNSATCNGSATDKVTLCLYNVAKKAFVYADNVASRADAHYQYAMPNNWMGDDFEAYIFFTDDAQKAVSKTQYLGHYTL